MAAFSTAVAEVGLAFGAWWVWIAVSLAVGHCNLQYLKVRSADGDRIK
jgi:hypothetical protein